MDHKVSIVVIGRNEERSIPKCFEAAVAAANRIGGAEMIYVDSHSTDGTVLIAKRYGFTVLPLRPDLRLSPSAGRYWGSHHAKGDIVLFLDADTLIHPDFLPHAIDHFEDEPTIGGINGFIDDFNEAGEQVFEIDQRFDSVTDVKWLRGPACLYRRKALIEVGSFNPALATEEEAELGLRLVQNGWKLKIIPQKMAIHTRCHHVESLTSTARTFVRDIDSGRLGEITRTAVYAFRAGNGLEFCWLRLKTTILFVAWVMLVTSCLLLPKSLNSQILVTLVISIGALMILVKKRSIYRTLLFVPSKILCLVDLAAGIPKILRDAANPSRMKDRSAKDLIEESP